MGVQTESFTLSPIFTPIILTSLWLTALCSKLWIYFFFHYAWRKHKQHLQIEHADKNNRFELFQCLTRASPHLEVPGHTEKGNLICNVWQLICKCVHGQFFNGPASDSSSTLKADFKKTPWNNLDDTCHRLRTQVINQAPINMLV